MKVRYPGPAVSKRGGSYFTCFKLSLEPGINDINDEAAEKLLALGVVEMVEEYKYKGPVPTEGEVVVPTKPPEYESKEG